MASERLSREAVQKLWEDARTESDRVQNDPDGPPTDEPDIAKLDAAVDELIDRALLNFAEKVNDAAAHGKTSVDLVTFYGGDKTHDFSTLFLVKGPREHEAQQQMRELGFKTVIERLRIELKPFGVRHAWQPGLNSNRVFAFWAPPPARAPYSSFASSHLVGKGYGGRGYGLASTP